MAMTSMTSSVERSRVNKLRIYEWNERVHSADQGGDILILIIKNKFTLNDFPKKLEISDRAGHLILRNFLVYYGFSEYSANLMRDQGINLSYPISVFPELDKMVSRPIWKDMVIFDRKDLFSPDFGCRIVESFQDTLFMYTKNLGQQISMRIKNNYSSFNGRLPENRLVIIAEIYRTRVINVKFRNVIYEYGGFSLQGIDLNHRLGNVRRRRDISLRWECLPKNPYEKIPAEFYDPYYRLGKHTLYNQFRRLVTEPDPSIDRYCPDKGQDQIWNNLGFIRARMYTLYAPENTDRVLKFLRDRNEGLFSASYPYEMMSAMEPFGFVEVKSSLSNPVIKRKSKCTVCLRRLNPDFNSVYESVCPFKSHIFHNKCWTRWYVESFTCPHCRYSQ